MKIGCILLAGGKGQRFGAKKQDIIFDGKPLWRHSYDKICNLISSDMVVRVGMDVPGGATRTMSVMNGLNALPKDTDRVIIAEAARPLVTEEQIRQLIEDEHPSVTFVRPLVNTVIYRNGQYINREELYDLLTPQAFDYRMLMEAYSSGQFADMTDETRAMYEFHGIKPYFIETGSNLYKVTYPGDIEIIEALNKRLQETLK